MLKIRNIHWILILCLILPLVSWARDRDAALVNATRAGKVSEVRDLIAEGADINAKNAYGKTVLIMAATLGNTHIVDILLSEGVEVNAKDNLDSTALIAAASKGNLRILKALLAQGADLNAVSKNGLTALSTAKLAGYEEVVKYLEEAEKTKIDSEKLSKPKSRFESKLKRNK